VGFKQGEIARRWCAPHMAQTGRYSSDNHLI